MSGGGKTYLALDLGAESGRAIAGTFDGERLTLREVHRFPNVPVRRGENVHWDLPALFDEVKRGISAAATLFKDELVSVGVDTWGVDYGLLDEHGRLMGLPHQYRDSRTAGIQDSVIERLGKDFLYDQTGIQLMEMNSLYQLLAEPPGRLAEASYLLFIPDLINYWLTGVMSTERTFASTSSSMTFENGTGRIRCSTRWSCRPTCLGTYGTPGSRWGHFLRKSWKRRVRVVWKLCFRGLTIRHRRWPRCLRAKGRGRS